MIRRLFLFLCLLVPLACAPAPELRSVPARTHLSYWRVETPLIFKPSGVPRVAVQANGRPAEMLLDTGFFASLVSPEFAKAANLPTRSTRLRSIDGAGTV